MKLNRHILLSFLLLLPLVASASEFQHIMDGFADMVIVGLFAIFVIALNIRSFSSGDVVPTTLAMNGLLFLVFLFRTDEDNMMFNLPVAGALLLLSIAQFVVMKRKG